MQTHLHLFGEPGSSLEADFSSLDKKHFSNFQNHKLATKYAPVVLRGQDIKNWCQGTGKRKTSLAGEVHKPAWSIYFTAGQNNSFQHLPSPPRVWELPSKQGLQNAFSQTDGN